MLVLAHCSSICHEAQSVISSVKGSKRSEWLPWWGDNRGRLCHGNATCGPFISYETQIKEEPKLMVMLRRLRQNILVQVVNRSFLWRLKKIPAEVASEWIEATSINNKVTQQLTTVLVWHGVWEWGVYCPFQTWNVQKTGSPPDPQNEWYDSNMLRQTLAQQKQ